MTCKDQDRWIIPKGARSKRLKDRAVAEREAKEEGGVVGTARPRPIGRFTHRSGNGTSKDVEVHYLDVEDERDHWPEEQTRKRAWVTPERGKKLVAPPLKKIIDRA